MNRLCQKLSVFAKYFSGTALVLMTLIITVQVFGRYVLNASPVWAEQAALLILIWCVFIAAAAGIREGFHIRIVAVVDRLPYRLRGPTNLVSNTVVAFFGAAMIVFGVELASATWHHVIPTLGIPRGFAYIPISVSGVLITLFSIERQFAPPRAEERQTWS
ncbi:MAG: TRAP transporter small permease [Luminiphilus sp.]|nr:TRAP transporter small permease [Luminiphilus sp.]